MLPLRQAQCRHSDDSPPLLAERPAHETVAPFVGVEFLFPEGAIADRQIRVPGAAVPEAAVDEDRQLEGWEDEVGVAVPIF